VQIRIRAIAHRPPSRPARRVR